MRKLSTLLVISGLVIGCNGASGDTTTTTTDDVTTSTAGETTTTVAGPTTTTQVVTTTQPPASGGGSDCLVGTWILDSEAFVENFDSIFAEAGMPDAEVSALDGSFTVDLGADGTLEAEREEWGFRITMPEGVFIIEINGTEMGTWSADGSTLTVTTDVSNLDVSASIEADGQVIEMPESQMPIEPPQGIATGSNFTCSGDVLTLTNAGVESVLNRA
ncbi:MAG TPA: hypothetical protein VF148_11170 [Acidimicrobiia bacterium]